MNVAYIFDDKNLKTGAHHINRLIIKKLKEHNISVRNYYPKAKAINSMVRFKGLKNILFFYSLIEQKSDILKSDIIQGTTYTPLCFLDYGVPVVCHFGSTTWGIIGATPQTHRLEADCRDIIYHLKNDDVISEINFKSRRPMYDIAEVELYTSLLSDRVVATSKIVYDELVEHGVPSEKIVIIHNAIEDLWFDTEVTIKKTPSLVFLGRVDGDVFNIKLKGIDRLISIYQRFKDLDKISIMAIRDTKLTDWMNKEIINHNSLLNLEKTDIIKQLSKLGGSFILMTSRYEGFSLCLIEAMSQGLIPISYSIGIAPEIIKNGQNGFIVKSVKSAEKIIKNLTKKPAELRRLALAARKTAEAFRGDIMADQLKQLYEEIIAESSIEKTVFNKTKNIVNHEDSSVEKINKALLIVKDEESKPITR